MLLDVAGLGLDYRPSPLVPNFRPVGQVNRPSLARTRTVPSIGQAGPNMDFANCLTWRSDPEGPRVGPPSWLRKKISFPTHP